ncbi:MAG: hypothetical protein LBQ89_09060 [Treponema sp.]|jgi:hypothetical protein|nr:hypothetical protein [Treponema sp.]
MKNTFKLLEAMRNIAIIALVTVIGFSFVSCDNSLCSPTPGALTITNFSGKLTEGQ